MSRRAADLLKQLVGLVRQTVEEHSHAQHTHFIQRVHQRGARRQNIPARHETTFNLQYQHWNRHTSS